MYKIYDYIVSKTNEDNLIKNKIYIILDIERFSNGLNTYVKNFYIKNEKGEKKYYPKEYFLNMNESHRLYKKILLTFLNWKKLEEDFHSYLQINNLNIDQYIRSCTSFYHLFHWYGAYDKIKKEWIDNSKELNVYFRDFKINNLGI
ncbi:MAG: hypothetical protein M0R46_06310 [Candidatus Muirbacterium halophilum]|nr:hypothetical protein [Candidatus Muirbacterium halophilum]